MRLRRLRSERGQTSLFMALFISTMILLFAFTTNIGMLVHAKINLQNAADAAAYAGAAVQARQLTAVGYLNYEMRRALKEFLFYYTVRGQQAGLPCFPLDVNGVTNPNAACPPWNPEARWNFRIFDIRETFNETSGNLLPTVCVIFDKDNNYCQKKGVAGIPEFPAGGGWGVADPIVAQVRNATNQIIDKKLADCLSRTGINQQFLIAWLTNLSPYPYMLTTGMDRDDPFPFASGLERIGILPRMAMLRARIDNYEEMLNLNLAAEGASLTIEDDSINTFRGLVNANKRLDYFERPLQAFLSAKNNLVSVGDNGIFAGLQVTELVPTEAGPGNQNTFLRNKATLVRFKDLYARVAVANSKFETLAAGGGDRGNCHQFREVRIIPHFPFGVTKDPNILTYYAVRVQAKARLLFSPFGSNGTVTLSAYSAAKPFGSRIGKDLAQDPAHLMVAQGLLEPDQFIDADKSSFPNVLVADNDADTQLGGFTKMNHLGYLRGAMAFTGRLDIGARLAGAYAPWEVGYYTVPANFRAPENIGLFEDNPLYEGKYFALAAPMIPVNGGDTLAVIRDHVSQYFTEGSDIGDRDTLGQGPFKQFLDAVMDDSKWAALQGFMEAQNQLRYHYIPDPLLNDEPDLLAYARAVGSRFTVAGTPQAQRRQLTSWNNQKTALDADLDVPANSELGLDIGRSGYSVRFVSFKTLRAGGRATNDPHQIGTQWTNPFGRLNAGDSAARLQDDLRKLKH